MKVEFKKLDEKAILPSYARGGDAGLDLTAISHNMGETYIEYGTGLAVSIPEGYVGLLFPRSSISKTNMSLANSVGVIDSGYRGEIKLRFRTNGRLEYREGDRIGQLIIIPFPQISPILVNSLQETERGEGGFGSTN